jgi:hypothetical protein
MLNCHDRMNIIVICHCVGREICIMEINSIHIAAFGELRDVTLDFSEGLNLYKAGHENDLSTIMLFIRVLFHGAPDLSSISPEGGPFFGLNPGSGQSFGGSIRFTIDGTSYLLEREFLSDNKHGKTSLKNLVTGEEMNTENLEPGEYLCGLNHTGIVGGVLATESHQKNIRLFETKEMYRQTEQELAAIDNLILEQSEEEIEDTAREEVLERSLKDLVMGQESQIRDAKALLENKVLENKKLEETLLIISGDLKSMLERRALIRRLHTRQGTHDIPARVFVLFLAAFLVSAGAFLVSLATSQLNRETILIGGLVFLLIDLGIFVANRVQLYRINRALIEKTAEYDSLMKLFDASAAAQYDREAALSAEEKKREDLLLHRNRLRENLEKDVHFRRQMMNVAKAKKAVYEMKLACLRDALGEKAHSAADKMPLLLDEAFIRYDDKKIGYSPEIIRELSKERQVLIFTCNDCLDPVFKPDGRDEGLV